MKVRTTIKDRALGRTLEHMVQDSASRLNLPCMELRIAEMERTIPDVRILEGFTEVDYANGIVELAIDSDEMSRMRLDIQEALVQSDMCLCKDLEEGWHGREVYFLAESLEDSAFFPLATELDQSYGQYLGGQRHLETFGAKSFRKAHLYKLEEIFEITHENIIRAELLKHSIGSAKSHQKVTFQQYAILIGLFKDYIKSDLIGHSSPRMREPFKDIARMLTRSFESILHSDAEWVDKSRMLFYAGMVMELSLDLRESYFGNTLVRKDYSQHELFSLAVDLRFDDYICHKTLVEIENAFRAATKPVVL
jgi:hypothetical protein